MARRSLIDGAMRSDHAHLLNHLLERERDVLGAVSAALSHDHDARDRRQLENFRTMHEAHVEALVAAVQALGETPAVTADVLGPIDRGKVLLGALAGAKGVLVAMKSNVDALANAYVRATSQEGLPEATRATIERLEAEAKWEGAWIESRLGLTPDVGEAVMADEGENERARERRSAESIH